MKKVVEFPFRPCISLEQLLAFDSSKSETHTNSSLVNTVMTSIEKNGMASSSKIAKSLSVDLYKLSNALQLMTGLTLTDIRRELVIGRLKAIYAKHPDWSSEKSAHHLGFSSRSALWRFCKSNGLTELYAEFDKN